VHLSPQRRIVQQEATRRYTKTADSIILERLPTLLISVLHVILYINYTLLPNVSGLALLDYLYDVEGTASFLSPSFPSVAPPPPSTYTPPARRRCCRRSGDGDWMSELV